MKHTAIVFALLALALSAPALSAYKGLSLNEYLNEVKGKHTGFAAAQEQSQGAEARAEEASLLLSPTVFGTAEYDYDKRPTLAPLFQGDKTILQNYSFGLSQNTSFGLNGKLYYALTRTRVLGASPAFLPLNDYYDGRPVLELSQSLWRNFLGAETRATQERSEALAMQAHYEQDFRVKQILAEAERAYWRMALAQSTVNVNQQSLERAQTIRGWLQKQVNRQLSDRSDFLQAAAAVDIRELDLASAKDEARSAAIAFNSLRNKTGADVQEALAPLEPAYFDAIRAPKRPETRSDVLAAEQRSRAAAADAKAHLSHLYPNLEVYGSMALYGRDPQMSNAISESKGSDHPYGIVGVRFSTPLDFGTFFSARAGYTREVRGAELNYERTKFEAEREWDDLEQKFTEAKKRLSLASAIVAAQKEKAEHERERHKRGRSTTYQVLTFEQDYATAQLGKLRAQNELLNAVVLMKTYAGDSK